MRCAIMQPTYLPWTGYFNLMSQVDCFVILDDVQFERRSWQSRNRIMLNGNEVFLTVPTKKIARNQKILDIEIDNTQNWKTQHWKTIIAAYQKANYGNELLKVLEPLYLSNNLDKHLSIFNIAIINSLKSILGLTAEIKIASNLNLGGSRTGHLIEILKNLECNEYLSPIGSSAYLENDNIMAANNIILKYNSFNPPIYSQYKSKNYISHLSIIDLIANIGIENSKNYINE